MNTDLPITKDEQQAAMGLSAQSSQFSPDGEIGLLGFLLVLAKHWKLIVSVPLVVAVLTAIYSLTLPKIYTAKTMITAGDDDRGGMMGAMIAQIGGLASLGGGAGIGTTKAELYMTMLKSESVKDPIIERFKLMQLNKARFRAQTYKFLDRNVAISVGKKDGVITIAVENKDPKLAADIANAYVEELGALTVRLSATGAGKNRAFLEEQLAKAKVELAAAEDALKAFQTRNKAVVVTEQVKATFEGVAQLQAQLVAQEVALASLRRQFTEESQEIKSTKATIADLRRQVAKFEDKGPGGSLPGIGSMPQLGQEYVRLMRKFKIQETLVELLIKQYEMSKFNEAKDTSPFQVVQSARVPELKSKPKRVKMVMMSAIFTGFCVVLVAFVIEFCQRMSEEERQRWRELRTYLPALPRLPKRG